MIAEHLTQAAHGAQFLCRNLRYVLHAVTAVEALLLLPMIDAAVRLEQHIAALRTAIEAPE